MSAEGTAKLPVLHYQPCPQSSAGAHDGVCEGRHVVLQHAQLVHVVLSHDVWPAGQHLPQLDEARPQCSERLPAAQALVHAWEPLAC